MCYLSPGDGKSQPAEAIKPQSVNLPSGDGALYSLDVAKCQVVEAEVSFYINNMYVTCYNPF